MMKVFYFSPTGGTKKVACAFQEGYDQSVMVDILTEDLPKTVCQKDDIVVVVCPVYSGRIPQVIHQRLQLLEGNGCASIIIGVYGNRAYDDALLEMSDMMHKQGCRVVGAIGALAEHSLSRNVAKGRPNEKDCLQLQELRQRILSSSLEDMSARIPGNNPYKVIKINDLCTAPKATCQRCGACASVCPQHIISNIDFQVVDPQQCILCQACIEACPTHDRQNPAGYLETVKGKLSPLETVYKENELFL